MDETLRQMTETQIKHERAEREVFNISIWKYKMYEIDKYILKMRW